MREWKAVLEIETKEDSGNPLHIRISMFSGASHAFISAA
jgi:hypothetical protein